MLGINRQYLRIILIGLASILLILALNIADKAENSKKGALTGNENIAKPSAYLRDSTFNIFNADGKLSKLHASRAYFFKDQDSIDIEEPTFSSENLNSSILLTAKKGLYHPSTESLLLEGNVIAKQTESTQTIWKLESNELNIDNKTGILSTNETVHITSGQHHLIADGITASLSDRKIKLLSNVRGKYVFE